MAVVLLAALHRGTGVPLDPKLTSEELCVACRQLQVHAVLCPAGPAGESARSAAVMLGLPVITATPCSEAVVKLVIDAAALERLTSRSQQATEAGVWRCDDPDRLALVLKTSGTTGQACSVPFTFRRLLSLAQYNAASLELGPSDVCVTAMPLFHVSGVTTVLLGTLLTGGSLLIMDQPFDATNFVEQLIREDAWKPTWFMAVPTMHKAIVMEITERGGGSALKHRLRLRLIRSSAALLDPHLAKEVAECFAPSGTKLLPAYGLTECGSFCSTPLSEPYRYADGANPCCSVGKIMSEKTWVKILSDGDIGVKGDVVMDGYWCENIGDAEDPNKHCWTSDGYFRTGDLGYFDEDGWLYVTGRAKELINRGGEALAPRELEKALRNHKCFDVVVAFAAPHSSLGECVAVACVLKHGFAPSDGDIESIHRHLEAEGLSQVWWPEVVVYCTSASALPMTRTGKIIRVGAAGAFGLTAEVLDASDVRTFSFDSGELVPEPSSDPGILLQDSMMQMRRRSRSDLRAQNSTLTLWALIFWRVCFGHWTRSLGTQEPSPIVAALPVAEWVRQIATTYYHNSVMMTVACTMAGVSCSSLDDETLLARLPLCIVLCVGIRTASSLPHADFCWPPTGQCEPFVCDGISWFFLFLAIAMLTRMASRGLRLPDWLLPFVIFVCAPFVTCILGTMDDTGRWLSGKDYLKLQDSIWFLVVACRNYWSVGRKLHWVGVFLLGASYGPACQKAMLAALAELPAPVRILVRLMAFAVVCALACLETSNLKHLDAMIFGLQHSPHHIALLCLGSMMNQIVQVVCIAVAMAEGNVLTTIAGRAALMNYVTHCIIGQRLHPEWFWLSKAFASLNFSPILGGILQLFVLLSYPVCYSVTVGPLMTSFGGALASGGCILGRLQSAKAAVAKSSA